MIKVFINGSAGTTGLRLRERLEQRSDIALINIDDALRKDKEAVADCMSRADIAFLCLPDEAAKEAAETADKAGFASSTARRRTASPTAGYTVSRSLARSSATQSRAPRGSPFRAAMPAASSR